MKIHPPVILLALGLIACSMPGVNIFAADSTMVANSQATIVTIPSNPVPTPTLPTAFSPITSENAAKLSGIHSIPVTNISRLIWQPDSLSLTAIQPGGVTRYDAANLNILESFNLPANSTFLDYDAESRQILLTSDRRHLDVRSLDGKIAAVISAPEDFVSAVFQQGGDRVWVSSADEFKAIAIDVESGKEAASCAGFETAAPVYSASPSPAGKWLVWIARATLQINRLPDCGLAARLGHQDFIMSHTFSAGDTLLAVSAGGELEGTFQPLLNIYKAETGDQEIVIPLEGSPAVDLSFSPDSGLIAAAGSGLSLLDVKTGQELKRIAAPENRFSAVEFSPDGRFMAAADETSLYVYALTR